MSRYRKSSLYDRLGGIYPIAAVVNLFSENVLDNKFVGTDSNNPQLREWSRNQLERLPGLKWLRILWVSEITGGPYKFQRSDLNPCPFSDKKNKNMLDLQEAHCRFRITSDEFDQVVLELKNAMNEFDIPKREHNEILDAFLAHKDEVVSK